MNDLKYIVDVMLSAAKEAYSKGEIPVAAVIADKDFNIVSVSSNNRQSSFNVLGHAEILAIQDAERKIKDWRLNGYDLYVTLIPCEMCSVVIKECRLDRVFYLCDNSNCSRDLLDNCFVLSGYEYEHDEYSKLLTSFFENMR